MNKGWKIVQNPSGWIGDSVEIGYGPIYNNAWTTQICELDSNKNYPVKQTISLNLNEIYNLSSSYSIVSTTVNQKSPPTPVNVSIPTTKDKIIEVSGETLETIEYSSDNVIIQTILTQVRNYLISFQASVPISKI